jgi:hypothetical protein
VFAGSRRLPAEGDGPPRYAADVYEPRSIASIYNEPAVVLDVPRQVNQSEVYGHQVVNPEYDLTGGELLTVVMRPGPNGGQRRGRQVQLAVRPDAGETGLRFQLAEADGKVLNETPEITPALEQLVAMKQDGAPPYVTLTFDAGVALANVSRTAILMAMLETMGAARLNPPLTNQLPYQAFVPARQWQDPAQRPGQPWELHLAKTNAHVSAELVWLEPNPPADDSSAAFQRHVYPVADPAGVLERIETEARERRAAARTALPPVLLVYAPAALTYGQVLPYIQPVFATQRTVYVFVTEK